MRNANWTVSMIIAFLLVLIWSGCAKKNINPENNLSYKIGLWNYNYSFSESPKIFGGFYRSIDARQISGGFLIYANYTETTHNTINISFLNTVNDLPQDYYAVSDGNLFITMDNYKGPHGDFFILDGTDKDGYFKFDHVSEDYIEGSFSFKMIRADRDDLTITSPKKSIHLKKGKFRIQVH